MRIDHFLAFFPQMVSMYLLFCLLANWLSILAPLPIAAGAFRPTNIKGIPLLLNFAFMLVFPFVLCADVAAAGDRVSSGGVGLDTGGADLPVVVLGRVRGDRVALPPGVKLGGHVASVAREENP